MDPSFLNPVINTLSILTAILGVGAAFFGIPKVFSDLWMNRVTQRKHMAEMVGALTSSHEIGKSASHPMVIQAQFHAAFGGEAWRIPPGKDLLHFLANTSLASLQTARSLAASLPFVTYSELADGFTPSEHWTSKKLNRESVYQRMAYWVSALVALFCFANSLIPSLRVFATIGILYAIAKANRAGQINRARRLLKLTQKPTN